MADVVADALDGRDCVAHLVHLETHFDRAEVRRHITVLVLTEDMLVITHVDDQQLDEAGEQTVAQVSTESVPVSADPLRGAQLRVRPAAGLQVRRIRSAS